MTRLTPNSKPTAHVVRFGRVWRVPMWWLNLRRRFGKVIDLG